MNSPQIKQSGHTTANRSVQKDTSVRELIKHLTPFLAMPNVTEICVNRPEEVWIESHHQWVKYHVPALEYSTLMSLGTAVAKMSNNAFSDASPILSAVLPDGERIQFVMPSACEDNTISVTIRKPPEASNIKSLDDYLSDGFFDRIKPLAKTLSAEDQQLLTIKNQFTAGKNPCALVQFLKLAVLSHKNIVISGATGSGKTTFMKALMQVIPQDQRIITIEDVPELLLPNHPNHVHLFYPSEAKADSTITASSLLRSCLRMKPDRILLAELRGGETFDFINACLSGHGGSITSCHAGSGQQTFEYLALKTLQNPQGQKLGYETAKRLLHMVIDVVVHVGHDAVNGRHITEIWFEPQHNKGGGHD